MKKQLILSIALIGALTACKKSWLEIIPLGQQVATTTDDYDKIMNDPALYNTGTTGGWSEAQLMGDDVAGEGGYFVNKGSRDYRDRYFEWRDSIYPTADVAPFALSRHLGNMYQINKVINEVMSTSGGTDDQKRGLRAEALATRAWSTWCMAQYYCKPYVAATAGNDLGFPLITEADVNQKAFPRGTVQQTYDFIIKDLTDALTTIPAKPLTVTRWSKPAVEGFLGKVYLFMGKNAEALPLLKAGLADAIANGQASLYNYNLTLAPGGAFLPIDVNVGPANGPGNLQNDLREAVVSKVYYIGTYGGNYTGKDGLRLTPQVQALYGASDLRLQLYVAKNEDNTPNAGGRLRKYGVQYGRWGLQLSELYLLSAESKARANDLTGAVADVETLRKNRMPVADATVPAATAGNQTALIKFIIDERTREFAMEGYRWFDMRRLSVDPLYAGITFTHTIYNANGTTTVYTLNAPNRLTMKLPRNITDGNPDMQNNP
jgi:hypothetical protein